MKLLLKMLFKCLIVLAYTAYKAEGINALLLVMPAQLIAPTLRKYGAIIGTNPQIHSPLIIHNASPVPKQHFANLIMGDNCYIGRDVILDLKETIILESYVTISMRCTLLTHTDLGKRPTELEMLPASSGQVQLKTGAYMGACSTILEGVTVNECSMIAAGAVVISDIPAYTMVGGVPARQIRQLAPSDR